MKKQLSLIFTYILFISSVQAQWLGQVSGTNETIYSIDFITADTGYACTEFGNVLKTVDGGHNWNIIGSGPSNHLNFQTTNKGFGALGQKILKTENGGLTWDTVLTLSPEQYFHSMHFPSTDTGYAASYDVVSSSFLYRTTDGGNTWNHIYTNYQEFAPVIFFVNNDVGFMSGWSGIASKTTDGGSTWTTSQISTGTFIMINAIYFVTSQIGYVVTDTEGVYKTTDGGSTWQHLNHQFTSILYDVAFVTPNDGVVVGGNGFSSMILYQTHDGGNSWYQGESGTSTLHSLSFVDQSVGYASGSNGAIFKYSGNLVGIVQNFENSSIEIYPNPATDFINLQLSSQGIIELWNAQGQFVKTIDGVQGNNTIDLSRLPNGIYFLKAITSNEIVTQQFLKN